MVTKYDMTSGEQINQTGQSGTAAVAPAVNGLIGPTLSLQLLEVEVEVESLLEPVVMPPDLATSSIPDFLKQQR